VKPKPHIHMRNGVWCVAVADSPGIWVQSFGEAVTLAWKIHVVRLRVLQ
jgi:hypothetical protein